VVVPAVNQPEAEWAGATLKRANPDLRIGDAEALRGPDSVGVCPIRSSPVVRAHCVIEPMLIEIGRLPRHQFADVCNSMSRHPATKLSGQIAEEPTELPDRVSHTALRSPCDRWG
jgi:hypothetical protein